MSLIQQGCSQIAVDIGKEMVDYPQRDIEDNKVPYVLELNHILDWCKKLFPDSSYEDEVNEPGDTEEDKTDTEEEDTDANV